MLVCSSVKDRTTRGRLWSLSLADLHTLTNLVLVHVIPVEPRGLVVATPVVTAHVSVAETRSAGATVISE